VSFFRVVARSTIDCVAYPGPQSCTGPSSQDPSQALSRLPPPTPQGGQPPLRTRQSKFSFLCWQARFGPAAGDRGKTISVCFRALFFVFTRFFVSNIYLFQVRSNIDYRAKSQVPFFSSLPFVSGYLPCSPQVRFAFPLCMVCLCFESCEISALPRQSPFVLPSP